LNSAREFLPTDHTIYISAAKLDEAYGNDAQVDKIIERAIKRLTRHNV
jgi:pre-mRNA-processing factor 6